MRNHQPTEPDARSDARSADPLPPDVRQKLEEAHRWLRHRDGVLADRLEGVRVRSGRRVLLAGPDGAGAIEVNPDAVRALSPEEVAGAMVGSLLASPPETLGGDLDTHAELLERVERVRESLGGT